jgi:hypothetical protein
MVAETHLVSVDYPDEQSRSKAVETHESRIDRPFRFHETYTYHEIQLFDSPISTLTSIDDDKTWNTLKTDQTGRGKLPGIVAVVQPVWGNKRIGRWRRSVRHDESKKYSQVSIKCMRQGM